MSTNPPETHSTEDPAQHSGTSQVVTEAVSTTVAVQATIAAAPSTGKRQSIRNIARQLDDTELCHPGSVKLIVENLEMAEAECEEVREYVEKFHAADKDCAILREQLKSETAIQVAFGIGVGLGCALLGLTPSFWDGSFKGFLVGAVGLLLVAGGIIVRVVKR